MDLEAFAALLTPDGQALLAVAAVADVSDGGLLATASALRSRHPAELVAAALTQVRLRGRARAKFGPAADRMYFTPDGLEQATRAGVAAYRARRFAAHDQADHRSVLDLCCGIGADLIALARAGCMVEGVERSPLTAAVARANVGALGLADRARIRVGDAATADPEGHDAVFADPARRTARGRVFAPEAYEPSLTTVLDLTGRTSAGCVKVAPGIPDEVIPHDAEAEWISVDSEVKEAALWLGEFAGGVRRRATLLSTHLSTRGAGAPGATTGPAVATLVPTAGIGPPPIISWRRYLYEPDGAVIRAHLVAEVAAELHGGLADPQIAYITSDLLRPTPYARPYEIYDVLPFSVKRLRAYLRERGIGRLTIKKRGSAVDIERLRRDLRLAGSAETTLVLTRVAKAPVALLCHPVHLERW